MTSRDALPAGWVWTTLGHVCEAPQYGWTTPAKNEGRVRLLRTTDITSGVIDWASVPFCTEEPPNAEKYLLRDGDIVISRAGSVGYSCLIQNPAEAVFASYLIRFRPLIEGKYVGYFLQSPSYWEAISERSLGIAIPNVNASKLRQIPFPLAPLPEQHRIVAEIETQFSRLDAGVAALKRAQAALRRYKASVLKAACEGRLVPSEAELARVEGRDYEPASALLARILAERRAQWERANPGKRYVEPKGVDADGLADLREGWVWASMEQIIASGPQNGLYLPQTAYGKGTPILRIDDYQNGRSKPSGELRLVDATEDQTQKYSLHAEDLVINRVNSLTHLGKCLLISERNLPSLFESNMMRLRLQAGIVSRFVELYLWSEHGRQRLIENAKWAVNQASINQQDVIGTVVPLPPASEQHRIVAEVERRLSVAQEVEGIVAAGLRRAERLRQSLLKQAFAGRLMSRALV